MFVLAGSERMLGAAALTGLAAMRAGAGLVTCAVPQKLNPVLQKKISPVIMTLPMPQTVAGTFAAGGFSMASKFLDTCAAMAVGPGLGQHPQTQKLVFQLLSACPLPTVVDADALNMVAGHCEVLREGGPKVLTPHPGEMARLTGLSRREVEQDRRAVAGDFARRYGVTVVLKGHRTVIASEKKTAINRTGNSGMATAGSGDVLTGMIGALLAQGIAPFEAALWAAQWHGAAADLAVRAIPKVSLLATDIIDAIPGSMRRMQGRRL